MTAGLVLFNLLVNAMASFVGAAALVLAAARLLRIGNGRLRIALLLTPFVKAGYELARGIPPAGFFWAKLAGASQELGSFQIGVGVEPPAIPVLNVSLGALSGGRHYAQGVADLLATLLSRKVAPWAPAALGIGLAALVALRLAFWFAATWRGSRARAALLREARLAEVRPLGARNVRVYIALGHTGVPFAGGLFRPWIVIPEATYDALSPAEYDAVVAHELAHVRHHDVILLHAVSILREVLVFIPGAGALARAVRAQCEIAADASAVRSVPRSDLASALVRVAEDLRAPNTPHSELAFLRRGRLLSQRVATLLDDREGPRLRWPWVLCRLLGTVVVVACVMRATILGNP